MDPFVETVKGGIGGLSEVISLAEDLDGVAKQVQDLGKKELQARQEWRRKQVQVKGDYAFLNAVDEYNRVREALDMKEKVKAEVIKKFGRDAWTKVEEIEKRQKDEFNKLYTEDGHDRKKMFQLKLACFSAALIIVLIMWANGVIRQMSEAFYGS
jgi:hypothetical protein